MTTEAEWYSPLREVAQRSGWLVHHVRPAMRQSGKWSTPLLGDKGFPDFVFVHPDKGMALFREIKGARTKIEPMQKVWLDAMELAGFDADIWRMPDDWPKAVEELSFGRANVQL